jgi:hypothetical protein
MKTTEIATARAAGREHFPKVAATAVMTGALISGADNVQTVSLTAATLAVCEVARNHFGVRGLRSSGSRNTRIKPTITGQPHQG